VNEYQLKTRLGNFLAAFENSKLTELRLPATWRREKKPPLLAGQEGKPGQTLLRELARYLCGKPVKFSVPIAPAGTDFQKRIWKAMRSIPWGKTATYGQLAAKAGSPTATRATGSACGANRIIIINPCHRVLSASGLGGFGSGLAWKKRLLSFEGRDG
jgi:methylated-DNA-[protein]-cysteine S-methyltransferase